MSLSATLFRMKRLYNVLYLHNMMMDNAKSKIKQVLHILKNCSSEVQIQLHLSTSRA